MTGKTVLFLDDSMRRCNIASEVFKNDILHIVHTAQDAINLLKQSDKFQLCCLDHDLCGNKMTPSDETSGYEVAKFITTMGDNAPAEIIVHSGNRWGSKKMHTLLSDAKLISHKVTFKRWPTELPQLFA